MNMTKLPVLLLHNMVLFPFNEIRLEFNGMEDKQLISISEGYYNSQLLIVHPSLPLDGISPSKLPEYAVLGQIRMRIDMPNGKTRISVYGMKRVHVESYLEEDHTLTAQVVDTDIVINDKKEEIAYTRKMMNLLESYIDDTNYPNSVLEQLVGVNSLEQMTDLITPSLPISYDRKLLYILEIDPTKRSLMIMEDIKNDIDILYQKNIKLLQYLFYFAKECSPNY